VRCQTYQHPCEWTGTSIPPTITTQLHPRPSLPVPSPATRLTHNPKAIRPRGKLKQGELHPGAACSQGTRMLTAPQQPPAGEATGLLSAHTQHDETSPQLETALGSPRGEKCRYFLFYTLLFPSAFSKHPDRKGVSAPSFTRCFWPWHRARQNLSMQWPSPTEHRAFL